MTPFMTRQRRRLLIPIIHLITRIYHAYRLLHQSSSPPIRIPYQSRSSRARVTVARPRSPFFCDPSYKPKVLYRQVTLLLSMGSFRLHAVYHVPSELSFLSYLYQYLLRYPRIFHTIHFDGLDPFFFSFLVVHEVKWLWSLSLVIMRVSTLGLVFCFPLA